MKIKRLEIIDFGKFSNITLDSFNQNMVVVYGKNEAGKTTLFNLINSLIFGFTPAKNENHPYSSWKNERIEFKGIVMTDEGNEAHLYRRLLSNPKGQMTIDDKLIELKNTSIPFANHISWEIYNKLYALRVEDLVEIQGKAWEEVQDKLLANFGNLNIRNSRDVIKELKEEASQIFRDNGRGKTLTKEIEGEIRGLKKEKNQALETQNRLKSFNHLLTQTKEKIEKTNQEKIVLKVQLKRAKLLLPIKGMITEIEELKGRLVEASLWDSLPQNVGEKLREIEDKQQDLLDLIEKIKNNIIDKKQKLHLFTPKEEFILLKKEEIEEEYKRFLKIEMNREENQQLQQICLQLKSRLRYESRNLFKEEIDLAISKRLKELNIPELGIMITSQYKLKEELREVEGLLQYQYQREKEVKISNNLLIAVVIGGVLLGIGLSYKNTLLMMLGGMGITYGLTDWLNGQRIKKQLMKDVGGQNKGKSLLEKKQQLTKDFDEGRMEILLKFEGIPIPHLVLENLHEMFLSNLIKIKELIFQIEDQEKLLITKNQQEEKGWREINEFLIPFELKDLEINQQFHYLKKKASELENQSITNRNIEEDLEQQERDLKNLQESYNHLTLRATDLKEVLMKLGDGSLEEGLRRFEENQYLISKVNHIEEQLNKIPDLENHLDEIYRYPEDEWTLSDFELENTEDKIEEIEETLQNLKEEKKELEVNIQQLLKEITLDEIESRILLLQTQLEKAYEERDALILLAEIIGRAEELYREENQPDVLKNASRYLRIITGEKYTNIYLEDSLEGRRILLKEKNHPILRSVTEGFSKGTLHQLYLSLRLSLIDHLDGKGETLPISFDELLINWDEERLDYNLQLFKEISNRRQIFIFTCHDWMAKKIEDAFGIKRIHLDY